MFCVLTPAESSRGAERGRLQDPEQSLPAAAPMAFVRAGRCGLPARGLFRSLRINTVLQLSRVIITLISCNWSAEEMDWALNLP